MQEPTSKNSLYLWLVVIVALVVAVFTVVRIDRRAPTPQSPVKTPTDQSVVPECEIGQRIELCDCKGKIELHEDGAYCGDQKG